MNKHIIY